MNADELSILKCPNSGQKLIRLDKGSIISEDGRYKYDVIEGIYILLPERFGVDYRQKIVADFYATKGWSKSASGVYMDTAAFVDERRVSRDFTGACIKAVGRFLPQKGEWLLDAGCGPIPHPEYLDLQAGFNRRLCVDFSLDALMQAKEKLGDRGMYVVGDLTHLPIMDNSVDAAVSFHVVYHIAEELQSTVFKELSRVLKHDGTAAIVYRWAYSPISWRLDRIFTGLATLIPRNSQHSSAKIDEISTGPALYFHPHSLEWFKHQPWPFKASIFSFRVIDNELMRKHFTNHRMWRYVTSLLSMWQRLMPRFTGAYGEYPCIVIKGRRNE